MYLLDTHTFLWFLNDDAKLPVKVRATIEQAKDVYVSIGTFWEMAIKHAKGKLTLPASITEIMESCEEMNFLILPISAKHLERLDSLPDIHGDPFDRLFVCQAMVEGLTIITADSYIPGYNVTTLWNS